MMTFTKINKWIDEHREDILALNRKLVSIPSVNRYPNGDEAEVQGVIYHLLEELECETDMFIPTEVKGLIEHPAYLKHRNYENRPNVVGTLKGSGGGKSILFSGHVDTVPLGMEPWSIDPYAGKVKDGKQYGLGIYDMKSGIVAAIMALKAIKEAGISLKGDVMIETVVDEEYGGANGTLASRLRGYEADIAIIPEPSNMVICPASQGGGMYRITFYGKAGRAYRGETLLNPAYAGAKFIEIFREYEQYHGTKQSTSLFYQNGPNLPAYIQGVKSGMVHLPLSDRVPGSFTIEVWIQCYPEMSEEELFEDFKKFYDARAKDDQVLQQARMEMERLIRFLPGSEIASDHPFIPIAQKAAEEIVKEGVSVQGAPFACDLFMFNLYSKTPAIIWGPVGANAHSVDEYIDVEEFFKLIKMYALSIVEWCGIADGS